MFMVEENGKRLLLTGDGQQDIILGGLTRTGFLASGFLHLDVLKVQHHGSTHNMDVNFARHVSADNYVFCGNGLHGNPDTRAIDHIFRSRCGTPEERALAAEADGEPFHFWFSTTALRSSRRQPSGCWRRSSARRSPAGDGVRPVEVH
jgi:hypothetical protein